MLILLLGQRHRTAGAAGSRFSSTLRRHFFFLGGVLAGPALVGCGTDRQGSISRSVGGEADAFSRAPAPTKLSVDALDVNTGTTTNLSTVDLPATNIDLGNQSTTSVVRVRVNATDASGRVLVTGTSVQVQLGALDGATLPVFVQRTSEFARMPVPLSDAREAPLVANVLNRYVFVAGGTNAPASGSTQIYDLATLSPFGSPPVVRSARSVATKDSAVLLIDDTGATWYDLANAESTETIAAPTGGTFADVAGGATVQAPDGSSYVVGATRSSAPTATILKIGTDAVLSFISLLTPRKGATAVWATGRGLVVAGGSSSGGGVEVLPAGATVTTLLAYPADPVAGAGAAALDASHVLLAGGLDATGQPADTRLLDLACTTCSAVIWDAAKLPVPITTAQAFELGTDSALLAGDDATGLSHAFRVTVQGAAEIAFKIPRHGARGARVNPPAIDFVGGDGTIESFTP